MAPISLGPAFWALAAVGVAAAVVYGAYFLNRPASFLRAGVKTLFLAAVTGALIVADAPMPLVLAIAFSALGDFFLAFDKRWVLPLGILSFLSAHVLYVVMFTAVWFFSGDNSPLLPRYVAMGLVIATAIAFLIWMGPKLGWMAIAVVPYAIVITAMGVAAMWLPWIAWPAALGAVLFLISDFVLSAELFRLPPDAPERRITAPVVWWSYAAAQLLIIVGLLTLLLSGAI